MTDKQEVISNNPGGNWRLALVVQKGVCADFILCGLSPPVSPSCPLVHGYTLLTSGWPYQNPRFHPISSALKTH